MNTSTQNTGRKRTTLTVVLIACLVLAVGAGVFAWFSAQDGKLNTFVAGDGVTEPDKKPDPTDPEQGGDVDNDVLDKWLIETNWKPGSAIAPDSIVPKNPNVGIGKDSKDAYVFLEVENNLGNGAYFVLGDNWAPVKGKATKFDGATFPEGKADRCYTGGLFMYVGDSNGADEKSMTMLAHDPAGLKDKYTGEAFDKIYTTKDFVWNDSTDNIKVKAYLAAASAEGEDMTSQTAKDEIVAKAKSWADNNADLATN